MSDARPVQPPPPPPVASGLSIGDCIDASPIIAAPAYPETEANDGRCRCGKLAVQDAPSCEWHPAVRAHRLERLDAAINRMSHEAEILRALEQTIQTQITELVITEAVGGFGPKVTMTLRGDAWHLTVSPPIPETVDYAPPRLTQFPVTDFYRAKMYAIELVEILVSQRKAEEANVKAAHDLIGGLAEKYAAATRR